jgi:hypothetical protein
VGAPFRRGRTTVKHVPAFFHLGVVRVEPQIITRCFHQSCVIKRYTGTPTRECDMGYDAAKTIRGREVCLGCTSRVRDPAITAREASSDLLLLLLLAAEERRSCA